MLLPTISTFPTKTGVKEMSKKEKLDIYGRISVFGNQGGAGGNGVVWKVNNESSGKIIREK